MQRRSSERISINLEIRFLYGNLFYTGFMKNLSENNMLISTRKCLPRESLFMVLFRMSGKLLKAVVRVKRLTKKDTVYEGMGVEIVHPSKDYLELVHTLRSVYIS